MADKNTLIHRDDFKAMLVKNNLWPIPKGNPLRHWFYDIDCGGDSQYSVEEWDELFFGIVETRH